MHVCVPNAGLFHRGEKTNRGVSVLMPTCAELYGFEFGEGTLRGH